MLIKTPKAEIKEYFASHGLSQSKLKLLTKGVREFNKYEEVGEADLYFEEKEGLLLGSACDCKLTEDQEAFDSQYHMSDCPKPGAKVMSIVNLLFDREVAILGQGDFPALSLQEIHDRGGSDILDACDTEAYQGKWKPETRVNKIITEGQEYYLSLVEAVGKTVLSLDQSTIVNAVFESVTTDANTGRFFVDALCPKDIDVYHQLIIHVELCGVKIQCLLDILEINHTIKTVKVWDFKTMYNSPTYFPSAVRDRRYDFQVVIYTLAVQYWLTTQPALEGYTIINPGFIVETTALGQQGTPLMYTITPQLFEIALYGICHSERFNFSSAIRDRKVNLQVKRVWGIFETIELYKWHSENGFHQDKVVIENNGKLRMNWEGIVYEDTDK